MVATMIVLSLVVLFRGTFVNMFNFFHEQITIWLQNRPTVEKKMLALLVKPISHIASLDMTNHDFYGSKAIGLNYGLFIREIKTVQKEMDQSLSNKTKALVASIIKTAEDIQADYFNRQTPDFKLSPAVRQNLLNMVPGSERIVDAIKDSTFRSSWNEANPGTIPGDWSFGEEACA